jgi:replicative superfamily II helicase
MILKNYIDTKTKCLYLAPIKSLCQEKKNQWKQKFNSKMNVVELTGDTI